MVICKSAKKMALGGKRTKRVLEIFSPVDFRKRVAFLIINGSTNHAFARLPQIIIQGPPLALFGAGE
jgi:hypothetical protein